MKMKLDGERQFIRQIGENTSIVYLKEIDRLVRLRKLLVGEPNTRWLEKALEFKNVSVPSLIGYIEEGEDFYIVREHIPEAVPLDQFMKQYNLESFSLAQRAKIIYLLVEVLRQCSIAEVYHSGICPSSVYIKGEPGNLSVYVYDFFNEELPIHTYFPAEKFLIMSYWAPEMLEDSGASENGFSDLYSVGALMYFVMEGNPPFCTSSVKTLVEEVMTGLKGEFLNLKDCKKGIQVIKEAMSKDPKDRFSFSEMSKEIKDVFFKVD